MPAQLRASAITTQLAHPSANAVLFYSGEIAKPVVTTAAPASPASDARSRRTEETARAFQPAVAPAALLTIRRAAHRSLSSLERETTVMKMDPMAIPATPMVEMERLRDRPVKA